MFVSKLAFSGVNTTTPKGVRRKGSRPGTYTVLHAQGAFRDGPVVGTRLIVTDTARENLQAARRAVLQPGIVFVAGQPPRKKPPSLSEPSRTTAWETLIGVEQALERAAPLREGLHLDPGAKA
jgi:hypothetical protein